MGGHFVKVSSLFGKNWFEKKKTEREIRSANWKLRHKMAKVPLCKIIYKKIRTFRALLPLSNVWAKVCLSCGCGVWLWRAYIFYISKGFVIFVFFASFVCNGFCCCCCCCCSLFFILFEFCFHFPKIIDWDVMCFATWFRIQNMLSI